MKKPADNRDLSSIKGKTRNASDGSGHWLRFLAAHQNIHQLFVALIKSRLYEKIIEYACRAAVHRYQSLDLERAFQWLKNFRNFSEDTTVNALNEMAERSSSRKRLIWVSGILNGWDLERKARFLKRIFYNIVLNGINRKVIRMRLIGKENTVPNLSALMLATSSKCNLDCIGCESDAERKDGEATAEQLDYIIQQAKRLHIFHVVIIGKGEPLYEPSCREKIFKLMKTHWDLNFILFTNGTTLEDCDIEELGKLDNLFTFVSIDGLEKTNDSRRGKGTYAKIMKTLGRMRHHGLLYGYSATVFRKNYRQILSVDFLDKMMEMGCLVGIYLMFWPVHKKPGGSMILSHDEYLEYQNLYDTARKQVSIPLIDPEIFEWNHGCRSQRGSLIYIDGTTGKVMPCVKAPFSPESCNIYLTPHKNRLLDILKTDFFASFRKGTVPCSPYYTFMRNSVQ